MSKQLINDIFQKAHSDERSTLFEHEVYRLLAAADIARAPRHEVLAKGIDPTDELLASFTASRVVVKIVSGSIAHKSDVGGVAVVPNQPAAIRAACKSMLAKLSGQDVAGVMLTEFIESDATGAGRELLVGIRNTRETSLAKWYCCDASFDSAADAVQVHGAYGYSDEYDVERYLRNSKGAVIYEGSREIHQIMQAQYALGYRTDKPLRCELPAYDREAWEAEG